MACGAIVLLQDSCSAIAVLEEVRKHVRMRGNEAEAICSNINDYVYHSLAAQATFVLDETEVPRMLARAGVGELQAYTINCSGGKAELCLFCVGTSSTVLPCFVALPSSRGRVFLDMCLTWAFRAHYEQARQCASRFKLALLQTIGGGWASLRRVDKALRCALLLRETAAELNDAVTERKSRVFVGWALLWSGDVRQAVTIFEQECKEARCAGDTAQERRCVAALHYVRHNAF
ncbi:hypothetical protein DPX39_080021900 [Trypanosoma brucei equiperdum]|uniref:Uncharacterized protein n=1 Tax=Trypanosoma brucei equiperdum TaxID=630700 RepID=A0A3L6L6E9_9TRYP|nr:hypothetical protein DPX39_080021900 [Trypanosoma brucei equiperdum]